MLDSLRYTPILASGLIPGIYFQVHRSPEALLPHAYSPADALPQRVTKFFGLVSNKSIQISVLKSTQCSQRTFRDHPHTGPSLSNTLQIHLRQPGVQGSLKHGPFPSCSVLGLEYNIQFVRPCFTFSGRFLLSYHHATKAHAAAKGKEKTGDKTGVNCKGLKGKEQNNTVSFPLLR